MKPMLILLGSAAALGLAGCGSNTSVKESLGIARKPPDEFQVVTRSPLAMPPTIQLRPPAPGERRPQDPEPRQAARQSLLGSAPAYEAVGGARSSGELALLDKAGVQPGTSNEIRAVVNRESTEVVEDDRTLVDRLMFWRDTPPPGTVIDPGKESRRIQENAAMGQPVTSGETPIIERKQSRGISLF